jgi:hypothetical protein
MQSTFDRHVEEERLERYSMGTLPEIEIEPLEEHLLICEECQHKLEELDKYVATMRAALRRVNNEKAISLWDRVAPKWSPRFAISRPVGVLALACAAVLMVVVVQTWKPKAESYAPATVMLQASRGDDGRASLAPSGRPLELKVDVAELQPAGSYRLEIVNAAGETVWQSLVSADRQQLSVRIDDGLPAGQYWARLYGSGSGAPLLREFSLRLR